MSDPDATVHELLAAGGALGGGVVLMPCSDEWAVFVAKYADRLPETYRFPRLGYELARRLGDKQHLHALATEHGVASPNTIQPADRADAIRVARTLDYPVVIKTAVSRAGGNQMAFAANPDELVSTLDRMDDAGNLVCQRLLQGRESGGWLFNGYFDGTGKCVARFSGHKLRQWPEGRGITVLAEAARNLEVEEIAVRFLTAVGYRGAVDVDFVQDPADGRYYLLDVNPRLGGVSGMFVDRGGLDVPRAMYLDLMGETFRQDGQQEGHRFINEGGYLVATLKLLRARRSTFGATVRELLGSRLGTFRLTDPLPFVVQMASTIRIHAGARFRRRWGVPERAGSERQAPQKTPAA